MNKFYPFAVVIVLAMFVVVVMTAGTSILHFVSGASLVFVVLPPLAISLATFSLRELGRCFTAAYRSTSASRSDLVAARACFAALGRYLIATGIVGFLLGAVVLLANLGGDPSVIGAGTAIALLTVLYAIILDILVAVPFGVAVKRKLAEIDS